MNSVAEILKQKTITPSTPATTNRKGHSLWFQAKQFGDYVGLSTVFVLKLFKFYGPQKVLRLQSFLKDYPKDKRGLEGIAIWKLKNPSL